MDTNPAFGAALADAKAAGSKVFFVWVWTLWIRGKDKNGK